MYKIKVGTKLHKIVKEISPLFQKGLDFDYVISQAYGDDSETYEFKILDTDGHSALSLDFCCDCTDLYEIHLISYNDDAKLFNRILKGFKTVMCKHFAEFSDWDAVKISDYGYDLTFTGNELEVINDY